MAAILGDSVTVIFVMHTCPRARLLGSYDNQEKISFAFLYGYGALFGGLSGLRSSTVK